MRRFALVASAALTAALALALGAAPAAGAGPGVVHGRVTLGVEGARLSDVGPIVVYLEPTDSRPLPPPPARTPQVRQKDASFAPGFLAIARGQSVEMPNDDAIYHNVFSASKPNDFDLGLYPAGESRTVTFRHAGVVRTYCSIHESMNGTIFVSPTPFFDVVRPSGAFELRDLPPGQWRIRTWCERLPERTREISVEAGRVLDVELAIGGPP